MLFWLARQAFFSSFVFSTGHLVMICVGQSPYHHAPLTSAFFCGPFLPGPSPLSLLVHSPSLGSLCIYRAPYDSYTTAAQGPAARMFLVQGVWSPSFHRPGHRGGWGPCPACECCSSEGPPSRLLLISLSPD